MKLAIITERANITLGGAERSVFELAARMALLGIDVQILAAIGAAQSNRVKVLCGNTEKRVGLETFKKALLQHFQDNHYDIIHSVLPFDFADVYQPRGGSYPEAAVRNAISYGSAVLRFFKLLTSFANFRRTSLARAESRLCKKENGPVVAALSEYVKTQFKKYYNLPDERIYVCPNGIRLPVSTRSSRGGPSPEKISRADKLRAEILARFNIKQADEPVFFLFAAHNFRLKGLANLIKAFAILNNRLTKRPAFLIIVGRGKTRKYRRLAKRMNVNDRILFFGSAANLNDLLDVADVTVLPTYYDPSSRFILEALAAGKPVVTTKFNGAVDLFTADKHGKVFDSPDDIDSLAEAIRFYCTTENLTAAKKAILVDDIKSKVSIETHCRKLLVLYDKIIKKKAEK
ncbi:MAG: glycosyltransferase family 4 protein [Sedimentisphaerales bacterium]